MTLRRKTAGLLSAEGANINPDTKERLRKVLTKNRKPGLLAKDQGSVLKGIGLESAHNPTPFILTPGSTGV